MDAQLLIFSNHVRYIHSNILKENKVLGQTSDFLNQDCLSQRDSNILQNLQNCAKQNICLSQHNICLAQREPHILQKKLQNFAMHNILGCSWMEPTALRHRQLDLSPLEIRCNTEFNLLYVPLCMQECGKADSGLHWLEFGSIRHQNQSKSLGF